MCMCMCVCVCVYVWCVSASVYVCVYELLHTLLRSIMKKKRRRGDCMKSHKTLLWRVELKGRKEQRGVEKR